VLELYHAIEPYLAAFGFTALSAAIVFGALFGALKWFGENWINSKFSERLEAFKYAQQRELEQLKFQINASMDRAVKLHQREFETLPEAW
jgi:cell division protein FtsB